MATISCINISIYVSQYLYNYNIENCSWNQGFSPDSKGPGYTDGRPPEGLSSGPEQRSMCPGHQQVLAWHGRGSAFFIFLYFYYFFFIF